MSEKANNRGSVNSEEEVLGMVDFIVYPNFINSTSIKSANIFMNAQDDHGDIEQINIQYLAK